MTPRRRARLPAFLAEVTEDKRARAALLAGSAALLAAGLDPRVWGASLASVQTAIRLEPQLEALVLLAAIVEASLLILGGAIGDTRRARPIVLGGLAVELLTALASLAVADGPLFALARILGMAASAFVIPVSLAAVATSYSGTARATAIGIAYAGYGLGTLAGPILLEVVPGVQWPAYVLAVVACAVALMLARRWLPDLDRPSRAERPYVAAVAWWGLGIVALTTALIWFGSGWDDPIRWAVIAGGAIALAVATRFERRRRASAAMVRIDRRPVAVAIFVGLVLALAQTVPLVELPLFFELVLSYSPVIAILGLAPLFAAMVLAGPAAGYLLAHVSPRVLVGTGVVAVGVGDLVLAALVGPGRGYLAFVVPCLLVGAGFVVATTVRTAIIFAAVPRGLPATSAALNEASLAVGSRIGIVLTSAIVARTAVDSYVTALGAVPASVVDHAAAQFRALITVTEDLPFAEVASAVHPGDIRPYVAAYDDGVRLALVFAAAAAIVAGVAALVLLGRHDPLTSMWEHGDERTAEPSIGSLATPAAKEG